MGSGGRAPVDLPKGQNSSFWLLISGGKDISNKHAKAVRRQIGVRGLLASYLHNFIFIKTQKTGSTTVEAAFASICGPDDIVTPFGYHDETIRSTGKPVCRNFADTREAEQKKLDALAERNFHAFKEGGRTKFYSHMKAAEIKSKLPPEFWTSALKFTVERHPYEKVISKAFYQLRPHKSMSRFPRILERILEQENYGAMRYYTIDNVVAVDEIVKFENLRSDLQRVADRIGVKLPDELPRMKSTTRRDLRPAREILTQEQKDRIYRACKAEFDLLGYEP